MMAMPSSGTDAPSLAAQFDERLGFDGGGDFGGEDVAIHGERVAAGYARLLCGGEQQRIQAAQFLFEQPGRGGFLLRFQRIAAHQFGQPVGLVRRRAARGTHFVERDAQAAARDLPGGFRARQSAAEDVNGRRHLDLILEGHD